jgi:hypothetical protein
MWRFKDDVCETPEEYEKELSALREKLDECLDAPEDFESFEKVAAHILGQRERFPEVFERYRDVEPMVGDIMSRRVQSDFFKNFMKPKEE